MFFKSSLTSRLERAIDAGDHRQVRSLLSSRFNLTPSQGARLMRQSLRKEDVLCVQALVDAGVRPDGACAGSMALWVERVERSRRHADPGAPVRLARARLALHVLHAAGAPWEEGVPGLGSGDSARVAIEHLWPGALRRPAAGAA